jgi:hypothetical protein
MAKLKVPLALTQTGAVISPEKAEKGAAYSCPGCHDHLILKKGGVNKPHFSHKASDVCTNETIMHQLAKKMVAEEITHFLQTSRKVPQITRSCPSCGINKTERLDYILPYGPTSVAVEVRLESGFIADVAIFSEKLPIFAIEIFVTHAVDELKAAKIGVPFIELAGEAVIASPRNWVSLQTYLPHFHCATCREVKTTFERTLSEIGKASGGSPKGSCEGFMECSLCNRTVLFSEHCPHCNNRLVNHYFQPLFSGPFCWIEDKSYHLSCSEGAWAELCGLTTPKRRNIFGNYKPLNTLG